MQVTGIGHAGLYLHTAAGTILCDPWRHPAYFGSWLPFPDNSGLDWAAMSRPDFLYVSHLHRDHFDPQALRQVDRRTTVLLPEYPTDELRDALTDLGFTAFLATRHGELVEVDGLRLMILAMTSPTDGPIGDSALAVDDGQTRLLNMNDARPVDLDPLADFGDFDGHFLQFSGAIWWPVVYDLPAVAKGEFGRRKRANGLARALRYAQLVGARHVFPTAGPPCFLDPELAHLNDVNRDETNIFPDQTVFLDYLRAHGMSGGRLLLPGSVATFGGGGCTVVHPAPDEAVEAIFTGKAAYLRAYAERAAPALAAERASRPRYDGDLLDVLKPWWEPLLALAERIRAGVAGSVLLEAGDDPIDHIVIDFPAGEVRRYAGEPCRYRFHVDRSLIGALAATREVDWVNSLFLSLRFRASRIGPYNEYVYTFFKCLSPERISYADGWYAEQSTSEDIRLDDWYVQRRCPHLKADLSRFGEIDDGVLTCRMHGWRFELASGRCLTAAGHELRARPAAKVTTGVSPSS